MTGNIQPEGDGQEARAIGSMPIFLDTADVDEIERFHGMGVIRGVTTNPTIFRKAGVSGNVAGMEDVVRGIAGLIAPWPLSVEVTTNDPVQVVKQAIMFREWAPNVVVKVPVHGPNGETENLALVKQLEANHGVPVNVTAMMSAQQGFLAALAGASYVSLFCGRVNNMGHDSRAELARLRGLLDRFELSARIIAGSTREILNVVEWLEAGADVVTVLPNLLEGMIVHPYTLETVRQFLSDASTDEPNQEEGTPTPRP